MTGSLLAIVLAAGKGTRMESELPKVLFPVLKRPMIDYVLDVLEAAGVSKTAVVVGYRSQDVIAALEPREDLVFVEQNQQLGTGHAVMMCRQVIADHEGPVLIVTGDSPLIQLDSVKKLQEHFRSENLDCLLGTLKKDDPAGLGRIVRNDKREFTGIVEEKDATEAQRRICEVNMSVYLFQPQALLQSLDQIDNRNRQSEYYITDCPGILKQAGHRVDALAVLKPCEALSINCVEDVPPVEAALINQGDSDRT